MQTLLFRPIKGPETDLYCEKLAQEDPERFLRMPPRLALEEAAESGMAVGGFLSPDNVLVCGAVGYDREANEILRCREFGSVFAHPKRYGLMRVMGSVIIVLHKLLDREGLPLIGVAANDNFNSIKQLERLHFGRAAPELVDSLKGARPLLPGTRMLVFDEDWLVTTLDDLMAIHPRGMLWRSVEPKTPLAVSFDLPLLPPDLLRTLRTSLQPNLIKFPSL